MWDRFCLHYLKHLFATRAAVGLSVVFVTAFIFDDSYLSFLLTIAMSIVTVAAVHILVIERMIEKVQEKTKLSREDVLELLRKERNE